MEMLNTFFSEKNIHSWVITLNSYTFVIPSYKLNALWSDPLSCHYSSYLAGGPLKIHKSLPIYFLLTIHAGYTRQANCDTYSAYTCSCLSNENEHTV